MVEITSAAGVLALLDEPDTDLQVFALERLDEVVDQFWAEIADHISKIEVLYENGSFSHRELASLIVSKVYYHLGEFDDSLTYALGAGTKFDVNQKSQYVEKIISKCIDQYIAQRTRQAESAGKETVTIDARLESIVDHMFAACLAQGETRQAIGIALEARRIDIFEKAVRGADNPRQILGYALEVCMTLIQSREFRNQVLGVLVGLYTSMGTPDHISVCQCLMFLDDYRGVAERLTALVHQGEEETLVAYQVAFDVYESGTQHFVSSLRAALRAGVPPTDETRRQRQERLDLILSGELTIGLHLEFLYRNNHTDLTILKNTKNAVLRNNSVCHTATVVANAYMHAGTTVHEFLKENIEWLGRAANWAKFTATASLGVIHMGHVKESRKVLQPYLPTGGSGSPYSEGGSLFALGLIHANHGEAVKGYLMEQLRSSTTEILQHGACLGLGTATMATGDDDVYEELKNVLYTDSAVAGEAAGIAMGLVMLGTASAKALQDMLQYAHETQHEKIIRGLAVGISLIMYGREEEADQLIDTLSSDKDPLLRLSAMYTVAMAYIGTANNKAILRLLHFAVSDVSDDVRRAAVTSLGFLLFRVPQQCPAVVSLLAESYNPHVRYGAALALGYSCAGTGMKEALSLLEPMANDAVDYVRQGALLAMSMVMIQQSEAQSSKTATVRRLFEKVVNDKHEDVMAKFGAILAQGIIDAGGRNVTISLMSRTGFTNMTTAVGLLLFTQLWYWYPLANYLALAFTPTALVALNKDLQMPKVTFKSNARPSMFAYPPDLVAPKVEAKEKVSTAVLSITQKQKQKQKKADKDGEPEAPEAKKEDKMDVDKPEEGKEEKKEEAKEPSFEIISNPCRVVPAQRHVIELEADSRWQPCRALGGVVLVSDTRPSDPVEMVELTAPKQGDGKEATDEEQEPGPPEPFEFDED
eukprot:comp22103_c0_seq1/m.32265 comp22103_c0_seq1/g.32265  ORF comp22103_c0_seq1/g.32265 comp22103_c0_seq1/m.32265 type:complete len:931 (-) comp22103_c0_seq1:132-2924(-)